MDFAKIEEASNIIRKAKYAVAFTGAGISVASGIPPFRGENGLWNKVDPIFLEINYFHKKPYQSWQKIKEIFYDSLGDAKPNIAHEVLAKMEQRSFLETVITQNIDHLHQKAGNRVPNHQLTQIIEPVGRPVRYENSTIPHFWRLKSCSRKSFCPQQ